MNGITFNNMHCSSIPGLTYISSSPFVMPETKDQYVEIPFMHGSYLIPDKSKRDIEITVKFTLTANSFNELFLRFIDVQNWLYTETKEPLIFDAIPTHYFKAKVVSSVKLEQPEEFDEVGDFTVTFRCDPNIYEVKELWHK